MRKDFKNGPVRPIDIPWPKPENPVPSKRVGLKQGGAFGPLRGTTAGGVAKAFRGKAGFKESQALQKKLKPHITEKRSIGEVSYTKLGFKKWKKSKTEQYKRKQAHVEAGKQRLQAKYPGFKFKSKGGKV